MKLLVIILNFRVTDLTIACMASIAREVQSVPGMKVAVCENGSGGDAEERIQRAIETNGWNSWAELTAIHPNRGFTGGNNYIIRKALASDDPPDYFLLLNADTLVRSSAFSQLVQFMDHHEDVGIAGSRLECPDGSHQSSPFRFHSVRGEFDRGLRLGIVSRFLASSIVAMAPQDRACPVDWVSGASMIVRREVVDAIGPLDEDLYTYFDDVDYCLNAKRAGWRTWFVPESRVIHLEGASTGITKRSVRRRPEYWFQARRHFFLKNFGPIYTAAADMAFLTGFAVWRVRRFLQRLPDNDPPRMLFDAFRHSVFVTGVRLRPVQNPALLNSSKRTD